MERHADGGYLLAHFTGESPEGEQVYFSVSRDGLHWKDLNQGKPILHSEIGEKGVRDPFILSSRDRDRFFIIATDLRIASGKGWSVAQRAGSRALIVWESQDLVHWQGPVSCEVGIPEAGCVWAPEAVYDEEEKAYMVFWASMVQEKHRIYCAYTKDFHSFTEPKLYIEREESVIDTTIIKDGKVYYRFSKDETTKNIRMDAGESLQGEFKEVHSEVLDHLMGVEGPAAYPLNHGEGFCLIVDRFAEGKGYLPLVCRDLQSGEFQILLKEEYDMGENRKRHGSVLPLTQEEYRRLVCQWGEEGRKCSDPVIPGLYADPDMIKEGDTYYLYPTTDGFPHWSGAQFKAFSSKNLRDWKEEGVILDLAAGQVPWAVGSAWAPAVWKRNGRFYFYFCGKRPDGVSCIGVAVSDHPASGFRAMDKPLLTPEIVREAGVEMGQTIDPSLYEEDGKVYLLFGNGRPAIVMLSEDMLHIMPQTMKNLEGAKDFREAVTVFKQEGRYHFTWSCEDTGDENYHVNYGVSDRLYGPIEYQYPVLGKAPQKDIFGTGHHCILRLGEGDYVCGYHRFATPTREYPEGKGYHRELCIEKVTFSQGLMQPIDPR